MKLPETNSKNSQIPKVMKIRPVVAEVFHAGGEQKDGQAWQNSVAFRKFCGRAKKVTTIIYSI